jgi:oligopeptidase A
MPLDIFNKLVESKNFQAGMQTVRQVEFALFDMLIHMERPSKKTNIIDTLEKVRDEVAVVRPPKWNRFPHSFGHIFSGGYAAGYYSYKWAEVLSADVFEEFINNGVLNKNIGEKFRREILSVGGSRTAKESFISFKGREPSIDALLKHNGLAA